MEGGVEDTSFMDELEKTGFIKSVWP